jgi:hypothetical protein
MYHPGPPGRSKSLGPDRRIPYSLRRRVRVLVEISAQRTSRDPYRHGEHRLLNPTLFFSVLTLRGYSLKKRRA